VFEKSTLNLVPSRKPQELCEFPVSAENGTFRAAETTNDSFACVYSPRGRTCSNRRRQMAVSPKKSGLALSACRRRRHTKDGRKKESCHLCCFSPFCKWADRQTGAINDSWRVDERGARASLFECPRAENTLVPLSTFPFAVIRVCVCAENSTHRRLRGCACSPAGKSN